MYKPRCQKEKCIAVVLWSLQRVAKRIRWRLKIFSYCIQNWKLRQELKTFFVFLQKNKKNGYSRSSCRAWNAQILWPAVTGELLALFREEWIPSSYVIFCNEYKDLIRLYTAAQLTWLSKNHLRGDCWFSGFFFFSVLMHEHRRTLSRYAHPTARPFSHFTMMVGPYHTIFPSNENRS